MTLSGWWIAIGRSVGVGKIGPVLIFKVERPCVAKHSSQCVSSKDIPNAIVLDSRGCYSGHRLDKMDEKCPAICGKETTFSRPEGASLSAAQGVDSSKDEDGVAVIRWRASRVTDSDGALKTGRKNKGRPSGVSRRCGDGRGRRRGLDLDQVGVLCSGRIDASKDEPVNGRR
jgi:hypothetical protein